MKRFSRTECPDAADGRRRRPGVPVRQCRCAAPPAHTVNTGILPATGAWPCGSIRQPW